MAHQKDSIIEAVSNDLRDALATATHDDVPVTLLTWASNAARLLYDPTDDPNDSLFPAVLVGVVAPRVLAVTFVFDIRERTMLMQRMVQEVGAKRVVLLYDGRVRQFDDGTKTTSAFITVDLAADHPPHVRWRGYVGSPTGLIVEETVRSVPDAETMVSSYDAVFAAPGGAPAAWAYSVRPDEQVH